MTNDTASGDRPETVDLMGDIHKHPLAERCALEFAYLAGCIDSDGYISVIKQKHGKAGGSATYCETVGLKQVTPQVPYMLVEHFGGTVRTEAPSAEKGRDLYLWRVTATTAYNALCAILPHLRIKRQQAVNCLSLREFLRNTSSRGAPPGTNSGGARRPACITEELEAFYATSRRLNKVRNDVA